LIAINRKRLGRDHVPECDFCTSSLPLEELLLVDGSTAAMVVVTLRG